MRGMDHQLVRLQAESRQHRIPNPLHFLLPERNRIHGHQDQLGLVVHRLKSHARGVQRLVHTVRDVVLRAAPQTGVDPGRWCDSDSCQAHPAAKLTDLFDTISHCDVEEWLKENHEELHRLFAFVRGDDTALRGLKHRKTICKRVAEIVRARYRNYRDEDGEVAAAVPEGAAADVGCLIGEMHLQQQEFHKAIEAFSRAIANDPTPDAYAGRARAYRALAALDDHSAAESRARAAH